MSNVPTKADLKRIGKAQDAELIAFVNAACFANRKVRKTTPRSTLEARSIQRLIDISRAYGPSSGRRPRIKRPRLVHFLATK